MSIWKTRTVVFVLVSSGFLTWQVSVDGFSTEHSGSASADRNTPNRQIIFCFFKRSLGIFCLQCHGKLDLWVLVPSQSQIVSLALSWWVGVPRLSDKVITATGNLMGLVCPNGESEVEPGRRATAAISVGRPQYGITLCVCVCVCACCSCCPLPPPALIFILWGVSGYNMWITWVMMQVLALTTSSCRMCILQLQNKTQTHERNG